LKNIVRILVWVCAGVAVLIWIAPAGPLMLLFMIDKSLERRWSGLTNYVIPSIAAPFIAVWEFLTDYDADEYIDW